MKIAVTTPTGNIGSALAPLLLDAGVDVTVLARNPDKLDGNVRTRATVAQGDLNDSDFVTAATKGADALFWLTPPPFTVPDPKAHYETSARNARAAVETNNIGRVVHLSSAGADKADYGFITYLGDVENALNETNAHVLHLRPGFFMENFLQQVEPLALQSKFYLPIPAAHKFPYVATKDIAASALAYLLNPASWSGKKVLGLHGPADLSPADAAKVLSQSLGRTIEFVQTTPQETGQQFLGMGASPAVAAGFVEMYEGFNRGERPSEERTAETSTPTTLDQWARQVLRPAVEARQAQG